MATISLGSPRRLKEMHDAAFYQKMDMGLLEDHKNAAEFPFRFNEGDRDFLIIV